MLAKDKGNDSRSLCSMVINLSGEGLEGTLVLQAGTGRIPAVRLPHCRWEH